MEYILTLLFIAPFVSRKESRWFLIFYAFILLISKDIRLFLPYIDANIHTQGRGFFEFYSLVQLVYVVAAGYLLQGWQRLASITVFLLFSVYNISLHWWWGSIPLLYYDWISLGVAVIQAGIVTFYENSFSKTVAMVVVAGLVGISVARYI